MFHNVLQNIPRNFRFTQYLLLIQTLFTGTFFIYRDFGIRMIFGFGALCLILLLHFLGRMAQNRPPVVQPVHLP